ncbi:unnamed protein product [Paramecium octaurelia]|uniref:FYVE-type domain-containing protein n=1 Tax=Paramecium octaurelia TaxID=43137 RepID=A0A8S1X8T3_PAROT|nr:unnamed protein product [Paramecium octaurelia]
MSQRKSLAQAHIKTVLISEARGKFKRCQLCQKEFGLLKPEHQCKRCRRAVCKQCSEHKIIYITETGPSKRPRRICNSCKDESDWIKKFIEQQKIVFGTNTVAIQWLQASGLTVEHANQEYEKAQKEQSPAKENIDYQKMKSELNSVMIELWLNLNFSLREFITYIIKDNEHELLTQKISKVLGSLLIKYPDIGYSADQILITLFLLCFSSEASAYVLLTVLYSDIIPFNTYPSQLKQTPYDYLSETEKIAQVLEQAFKLKQNEVTLVKPFMRNKISRYLQPFGINFFLLQTSFFFLNQMFLSPTLGYDNFLKCLASAFYTSIDEIKQFNQQFDEIEGQIMKGITSGMIEKHYVQTKLIIFLSHSHVMTQSVIVSRPLEKNKETHQIKAEFHKDQNTQQQNEQNEEMLIYSVTQSNEFQNLRRKTVQIAQQPQVDEEKETLKKYIVQIEELLMTKHKLVTELQLQVKELQNQPLQIINKDVDQQILEDNDQLRKKITMKDLEIQALQEQKKYSDKIQEDNQNIINNLQKSNQEIYTQLNAQISQNQELQQQIADYKTLSSQQSDNSMTASQGEKNYQINISLQSRQSEQELALQLEQDRYKIFQLELQVNQLNKEYIALQQLNQDKLRIIGNLEVRLIQTEAAKREYEKFSSENVEIKKKLQNHELVIIQQAEQLQLLQQRYDLRLAELEDAKKERFQLAEELNLKNSQQSQITQELHKQLSDLQILHNSVSDQLNQALSINEKLKQLIIEKDNEISEYVKLLSERDLLIVALKEADLLMKDRNQNLTQQFENSESQLHKIQQEYKLHQDQLLSTQNETQTLQQQLQKLISEHQQLSNQNKLLIIELEDFKLKCTNINQEHIQLSETHKLIVNELDSLKQRFTQLLNDHNNVSEQYKLIQIQFEEERTNSTQVQEKNRIIDELKSQLLKLEETHQVTINLHLTKIQELELLIITHEKGMSEFKSLSEIQKNEITDLLAKMAQSESEKTEHIAKNQSLTIQLNANIEKINDLESQNNTLQSELQQLQKRFQESSHLNGEQKVLIIQLEERITVLIAEVKTKEGEIVKLIQVIESQKQSMIDYEELIRKLKAQIVELEKSNLKLKTTLKHYKELSKEMAEID